MVALLVLQDPEFYDDGRKDMTIWQRLEARVFSTLYPPRTAVRGDYVAVDNVAEALLRSISSQSFTLYCKDEYIEGSLRRLKTQWDANTEDISVKQLGCLQSDMTTLPITCLLSLSPGNGLPFELRETLPLVPVIALVHGFSPAHLRYETFLRLQLTDTYECDSLVCSSEASKKALSRLLQSISDTFNARHRSQVGYRGRIDVVPLCVDTGNLKLLDKHESRARFSLPSEAFILLCVGRLSRLKADVVPLMPVLMTLMAEHPDRDLCLVIAGSAEEDYMREISQIARALGIRARVRIIQSFTDSQKASLYSSADVFVSLSDNLQESFGLSVVEAMSCSIPQVVADWNGYRDIVVPGETGFLIPTYWNPCDDDLQDSHLFHGWEYSHMCLGQSVACDLRELKNAISSLINNDHLRHEMGARSRHRALTRYSFKAVASIYEDLMTDLGSRAKGLASRTSGVNGGRGGYYNSFCGHASNTISPDSPLRTTVLAKKLQMAWGSFNVRSGRPAQTVIDDMIIGTALRVFEPHGCDPRREERTAYTLSTLSDRLAEQLTVPRPKIERHILWMIKQHLLEIV